MLLSGLLVLLVLQVQVPAPGRPPHCPCTLPCCQRRSLALSARCCHSLSATHAAPQPQAALQCGTAGWGGWGGGCTAATACSSTTTTTTTTTSSSTTSTTTSTTTSSMEMSIASRDELVDRLLAMGFREADCLVAISLYGTDIDQAISWLCDRPAPAALLQRDASKTKGVETTIGTASKVEPLNAVTAKPVFGSTTAPTLSNPSTEATAASSTNANSSVATSTAVVQVVVPIMQKEKDELRRINRAWNAKAEDEKRKVTCLCGADALDGCQ